MPMRIQNVLPKTGSTIVLDLLLENRVLETLTIESELLLVAPHVERDRVIPSRIHDHALLEVLRPLIHVRLKLADIRAHRDNVVHRENVADHGVDIVPRDLAAVRFRVPDLQREQRRILDPARHERRPVVRLRTVETKRDPVTLLQWPEVRVVTSVPLR